MPISKKTLSKIADLLKLKVADLEAAEAAETETEIVIDETLEVFTRVEKETRDKAKYGEGKIAGEEMLVDTIKKDFGVTVTGKDIKKVVEAIQTKAVTDAGVTPDEQVKAANKEVDKYKRIASEKTTEAETLVSEKLSILNDNKLLAIMPANRSEVMTNEEYLGLMRSKVKIESKDGKEVVSIDGKVIEDGKTFQPIAPVDAIKGYFGERKWLKEEAIQDQRKGAGGGNSGGPTPKFTKISEVEKHIKDQGISTQGEQGTAMLQAAIKDNPDIDMKS